MRVRLENPLIIQADRSILLECHGERYASARDMLAGFAELEKCPVAAFSVRKTQKDHGIVKWIEGDLHQGDRVIIVDDVATTGGSTIQAAERARSEGLDVVRVVILVDRQEGGIENIRQHVADVSAIISRDELMRYAQGIRTPS